LSPHDDTLPRYCVVEADSIKDLRTDVQNLLRSGWRCQGGVCAYRVAYEDEQGYLSGNTLYAQAMVKEK
jgi:hypothetical protein